MLKLFKFTQGWLDYYGAFDNLQEAYEKRATIDPTFHFTDVRIEEITLEGHDIRVLPHDPPLSVMLADVIEAEEAYVPPPEVKKKPKPPGKDG